MIISSASRLRPPSKTMMSANFRLGSTYCSCMGLTVVRYCVTTDCSVRILRRALRDVEERGRTLQSVVSQYLTTVKPMHEQYVEPSRKYADIVVLEGGHNLVALDLIMQRIANHIAEK